MQGKDSREGQRWKTMECLGAAAVGMSEDLQGSGFTRCHAAVSVSSFVPASRLNRLSPPRGYSSAMLLLVRTVLG